MPSYGAQIESLLERILHGPDWQSKVSEAARAADAAVKAEIAPFQHTGTLFRDSSVSVTEYSAGYGARITSLWRSFFVANARGRTLNRHRDFLKGRRSGKSAYRRALRSQHYGSASLSRHAASPSVYGEAMEVFRSTPVWDTDEVF